MTDKQRYQRRQLNKKLSIAMAHLDYLEHNASDLHKSYLDTLAAIDEERKKIAILEDKQERFYRKVFKRK